jgi:hypothetical protein
MFDKLLGLRNGRKQFKTYQYQPSVTVHQVVMFDNILIIYEKYPISFDFHYCKRFYYPACN